jgi:hypothetical protein
MNLLNKVDFVKCDVEGGEIAVLRGARQVRASASAPIWMIEVDEHFLTEAGNSIEDLMAEILQPQLGEWYLFYLDTSGVAQRVQHLSERRGTNNVFLVPNIRLNQFEQATRKKIVGTSLTLSR